MPSRLIQQNPAVDIGATSPLKLAINTAQYGRTFQDRSHIIKLNQRLTYGVSGVENIYNLNVRGKRGNIVQVQHNSPVWAVHMYRCHLYSVFLLFAPLFGGGGKQMGSELPASRTLHSLFLPPSTVIQALLWGLAHERSTVAARGLETVGGPLVHSFAASTITVAALPPVREMPKQSLLAGWVVPASVYFPIVWFQKISIPPPRMVNGNS